MPHTQTKLQFHCVFSTKDRRPFLVEPISSRLNAYVAAVGQQKGFQVVRIGGMPDHRHILVQAKPTACISDIMNAIKANSSRWLRREFSEMRAFAWQTGFGAFTVSHSLTGRVVSYINRQAEHHAKRTFQQEFLRLLDAHDIDYDMAHVFD